MFGIDNLAMDDNLVFDDLRQTHFTNIKGVRAMTDMKKNYVYNGSDPLHLFYIGLNKDATHYSRDNLTAGIIFQNISAFFAGTYVIMWAIVYFLT